MSLFTEYRASLKMPEVEEVIDLIFYRPLGFLLVKSIIRTRITPDQLTIAAIISGIIGGCFYASGIQNSCLIGALFYILFNVLDCSDGQLARLKGNGTTVGRLLDGIADYIATIAIYIGIAVGCGKRTDQPSQIVLLLALAGASMIIQGILVDYYRTRYMDIVLKRKNTFTEGIEAYRKEYKEIRNQKGKILVKAVILIYLIYSKFQKKLILENKREKSLTASPQDYIKMNRVIIRLWIFMGPSAIITTLIVCSLFWRFDIFCWIIIAGFNILAASLWLVQYQIDNSFIKTDK